jgi:cell division ATPase FtsA
MSKDFSTLIIDIGTGSIKMMVGNELSGKPVIVHVIQSEYFDIVQKNQLMNPSKVAQVIKSMYQDMITHFGYTFDHIEVVIPAINLDVYHGEKITNTVDPNGIIHPMDIQNIHSMFSKELVGPNVMQVCIVPVNYQIDGMKNSINPPLGDVTQNILLQAFVQYIDREFFTAIINIFQVIQIPVKRYVLDGQGIADMIQTQHKDFYTSYVLIDHGANQTFLHLISQHKLIRSEVIESGSEQLTSLIANRFDISQSQARQLKETMGYEQRQQVFDGLIYQDKNVFIRQSAFNEVIEEFYQSLITEMNMLLAEYRVDQDTVDLTDMPLILVGGGAHLKGIQKLLSTLGQGQGIEKPFIKTVGARNVQMLSTLGGLRFAHRYRIVEDDVRHHIRLERQNPLPKRRFVNYDEE